MGRDFHGFQRQPGLRTVESELLGALEEVGVIETLDNLTIPLPDELIVEFMHWEMWSLSAPEKCQ